MTSNTLHFHADNKLEENVKFYCKILRLNKSELLRILIKIGMDCLKEHSVGSQFEDIQGYNEREMAMFKKSVMIYLELRCGFNFDDYKNQKEVKKHE